MSIVGTYSSSSFGTPARSASATTQQECTALGSSASAIDIDHHALMHLLGSASKLNLTPARSASATTQQECTALGSSASAIDIDHHALMHLLGSASNLNLTPARSASATTQQECTALGSSASAIDIDHHALMHLLGSASKLNLTPARSASATTQQECTALGSSASAIDIDHHALMHLLGSASNLNPVTKEDEGKTTQPPIQQTPTVLDMNFNNEEGEKEDIHDNSNSRPPAPHQLKHWKQRLAIYAQMKRYIETVYGESDFSLMFIRGRNSRSSIAQTTASLQQVYNKVQGQLGAKERRIFSTFEQYKNWSKNTRYMFSHSNRRREQNLFNKKWLFDLLLEYDFQVDV